MASDNVMKVNKRKEIPEKRQLPKLMACMTKTSLENLRNKALFGLNLLDKKGIRRRKAPLHECLILEMKEAGFSESSEYLRDLIYDNEQIMAEDEIGIVIDIKKKETYLLEVCSGLQNAEKEREKGNTKEECMELLNLAICFAKREKGILWLAEKLFLASIAVSSKYLLDGGRQKAVCKYCYAKFLLDKCRIETIIKSFDMINSICKVSGADPEEEAFVLLTQVRDDATGKMWALHEDKIDIKRKLLPKDTVFGATALQLNRVLLSKSRILRKDDPAKAERLARLAERRARDARESTKTAEAIVEIGICQLNMNNLNNAQKTFDKAAKIYIAHNNIEGICVTKMHMASVCQKLRNHEEAARLLTEMGALAMKTGLRLQLGRALNLLGELHLRRERPELGTQHLAEAFSCFMGHIVTEQEMVEDKEVKLKIADVTDDTCSDMDMVYCSKTDKTIYVEEAEQSRLMMAVSAGQEIMSSYFHMIREANHCAVAQLKIIEWKLDGAGWWINRAHHDFLPCLCKKHQRSPLDVVCLKNRLLNSKSDKSVYSTFSLHYADLARVMTISDMRNLRNSFHNRNINRDDKEDAVEEEEKLTEDIPKEDMSAAPNTERRNSSETSQVKEIELIVSTADVRSRDELNKKSKVLINTAKISNDNLSSY